MNGMKHTGWIAVAALAIAGCGNPSDSAGPRVAESVEVAEPRSLEQPPEAVALFYEALRKGDDEAISQLLTDKARTETANSGLGIQSQGSERLEYELGRIEYVDEAQQGAHVQSLWIDYDEYGDQIATEVIWVLRKQANGWRVAGMATQVAEGELPLLFNFEDPEDMLRKKEYVERQYAEAGAEALQASQAGAASDGGSAVR